MDGWSDGLENKITIEIPAETEDGDIRSPNAVEALQKQVFNMLNTQAGVSDISMTARDDLKHLIQPWLGSSSLFDDLPMPGLISAQVNSTEYPHIVTQLQESLLVIAPDIRLDTHEKWLADLFRLTGSMQIVIVCFVLVIGVTTVAAVAGAVKSQIEIHRPDVELLHLMGAYDSYITRQFVRHSSIVVLLGSFAGIIMAALALLILGLVLRARDYSILPELDMNAGYFIWLLALPLFIWLISAISTRVTVLRVLTRIP